MLRVCAQDSVNHDSQRSSLVRLLLQDLPCSSCIRRHLGTRVKPRRRLLNTSFDAFKEDAHARGKMTTGSRLATREDAAALVHLSKRVQAASTASGSLKHPRVVGMKHILLEIESHVCFVLEDQSSAKVNESAGMGGVHHEYAPSGNSRFSLHSHPEPWVYFCSAVLSRARQSHNLGNKLMSTTVRRSIEEVFGGGTTTLNCSESPALVQTSVLSQC